MVASLTHDLVDWSPAYAEAEGVDSPEFHDDIIVSRSFGFQRAAEMEAFTRLATLSFIILTVTVILAWLVGAGYADARLGSAPQWVDLVLILLVGYATLGIGCVVYPRNSRKAGFAEPK